MKCLIFSALILTAASSLGTTVNVGSGGPTGIDLINDSGTSLLTTYPNLAWASLGSYSGPLQNPGATVGEIDAAFTSVSGATVQVETFTIGPLSAVGFEIASIPKTTTPTSGRIALAIWARNNLTDK